MVEKYPVRRAHNCFSIPSRIPGNAHPRLKVVLVGVNSLLQSELVIRSFRERVRLGKLRREFDVIPQSEIQGKVWAQSPGILNENAERFITEAVLRIAHALHQRAGDTETESLNRRKLRNACGETEL